MYKESNHWARVRLSDVAEEYSVRIDNPSLSEYDFYIGSDCIGQYDFRIHKRSDASTITSAQKLFKEGDYLLVRRSLYGSDFRERAPRADFDGVCSADILTIREKKGVIADGFLIYVLYQKSLWDFIVSNSNGGLTRRIKWKQLADYEFDLPPIEEQRILADKLWAAYRLKEAYKKLLTATQEMVKSQFIEMFYNGKYTVDKLREHIDVIRGVSYKPSDVYETHNENTSIVLRSNNIEGGQINFDDLVYVSTERVSELQLLRVGDIVMCGSNGSKKLVGKAAMLQETPTIRTSFGAFCLGIRCKPTLVPEYLATYFQTSLYRDEIEQLGSGSNILNIKPDHIYALEVPIPLYDAQMAFVSKVRQADKSEFELRKSIEAIDQVKKS